MMARLKYQPGESASPNKNAADGLGGELSKS
jgi:hypothetical protein